MKFTKLNIYLASQSPRRRELLEQIGIQYSLLPASVNEKCLVDEVPEDYVVRVALDKAAYAERYRISESLPERPVLAADTCVALNGEIFGKPEDYDHASHMLSQLSDQTHEVYTALVLFWKGQSYTALNCSRVTFCSLSQVDIDSYWDSGEPQDKAGSYAIQGSAAAFITNLQGSYSGVVGLPLYELRRLFEHASLVP
ncbi:Maf family protein [Pseudomonadota bacterium]